MSTPASVAFVMNTFDPFKNVLIAVSLGRRADTRRVAARARLRERERPNRPPRRHARKVPLLVLLRTVHVDELRRKGLVRHVHRARGRAPPRQFLCDDGPLSGRATAPAVRFIDAQTEQPITQPAPSTLSAGKITAPVIPRSPRREHVICKPSHRRTE